MFVMQFTTKVPVVDPAEAKSKRVVNLSIKKSEAKVVDKVDCGEIENLAEFSNGKLVMCRCWRSKTFPYCDGMTAGHFF
jgi:CDGSH-type Zn-finger protein